MFIKQLSSYGVDSIGRVRQRVTTYGKYKGYSIAIDNFNYKGKTLQKRFVVWDDNFQQIIPKVRDKDGKFKTIGQWMDLKC